MIEWFETPLFRFGLSGTLIALYGVADMLARRSAGVSKHAEAASPRWVHPVIFASITAYYFLIRPLGGPIAGGSGNLLGIALALTAMALRWKMRRGSQAVRYPAMATRMLFYFALPLAVGVPYGWLALTLPACLLSGWLALREDRRRFSVHPVLQPAARWVPGVW